MKNLNAVQYKALKAKNDLYKEYTKRFIKKNGWKVITKEEQEETKKYLGFEITNEDRSKIELYEFMNVKPKEYFAYIDEKTSKMTNWMGEVLGNVQFLTTSSRPSIKVTAINGVTYKGTYFKQSGTYCRIKAI